MDRITSDANGNPRYIFPWMAIKTDYKGPAHDILAQVREAVNVARKYGGKKYRGKNYGGGIVFSFYDISEISDCIKPDYLPK